MITLDFGKDLAGLNCVVNVLTQNNRISFSIFTLLNFFKKKKKRGWGRNSFVTSLQLAYCFYM